MKINILNQSVPFSSAMPNMCLRGGDWLRYHVVGMEGNAAVGLDLGFQMKWQGQAQYPDTVLLKLQALVERSAMCRI